jgi:hypothetical protein
MRLLRLQIVPRILPALLSADVSRRFLFRTVSQIGVSYRGSDLSQGRTGKLHAGDRLPWLRQPDGTDNFAALSSLDWQVHIYSTWTCPDIGRLSRQRGLAFHVFHWQPGFADFAVVENAVYLIRPDGYIAFADAGAKARTLAAYLDAKGLSFA